MPGLWGGSARGICCWRGRCCCPGPRPTTAASTCPFRRGHCRVTVADTALDGRAFCDTGFSVQAPLSGRTVVLVRFGAVQGRLPPALSTYLEQHFAGATPLPVPALGVRLVPCTTVAGHCILPAVPASLCCTASPAGQGMAEHLYAAFADLPPPPDGWEVLVGVEAWEMIHPLRHRQA